MAEFILKFFLTNILFSAIIAVVFLSLKKSDGVSHSEIVLYSLGLGPPIVSLLLYWLFLIFPHCSNGFYLLMVLLFFLLLIIITVFKLIRWRVSVLRSLCYRVDAFRNALGNIKMMKLKLLLVFIISIPILLASFMYAKHYLSKPLYGHDILAYGTIGKIYYIEKSIEHSFRGFHPHTGFSYFPQHAPGLSLLSTWERILNLHLNSNNDYYFKSITVYYGMLILALAFFCLNKRSTLFAFLGVSALFSAPAFFMSFRIYHIDLYRIFLLTVSWIFLAYSIKDRYNFSLYMFGLCSGLSSFSHTIGAIVSGFGIIALLIFLGGGLRHRFVPALKVILLIILFGGIHYIIDTFWGTGWIFS